MSPSVRSTLIALTLIGACAAIIFFRGRHAPIPAVFGERLSIANAEAQSLATGKPLLVFATADWCGPCQEFKRTTLVDAEVESVIRQRFIPVYVNVDDERQFAASLSIVSIPASIVLVNDRPVAKVEGGVPREAYLAWLRASPPPPGGM